MPATLAIANAKSRLPLQKNDEQPGHPQHFKGQYHLQPGTQLDNISIMESVSIILECENAFVNEALRDREDSTSFHIASQGSTKSISPKLPLERSSLEFLELASSEAYISLPENQDAISTALPNSNDEEIRQ